MTEYHKIALTTIYQYDDKENTQFILDTNLDEVTANLFMAMIVRYKEITKGKKKYGEKRVGL